MNDEIKKLDMNISLKFKKDNFLLKTEFLLILLGITSLNPLAYLKYLNAWNEFGQFVTSTIRTWEKKMSWIANTASTPIHFGANKETKKIKVTNNTKTKLAYDAFP